MSLRSRGFALALLGALAAVAIATPAAAQGKGKPAHAGARAGKPKRRIAPDDALSVTRAVLIDHGYEVVRVETVDGARVVYYRRGNMGRGKGKGKLEKLVIRPSGSLVAFEEGTPDIMVDIRVRLDL